MLFGERWCVDNGFKTHLNGTQIHSSLLLGFCGHLRLLTEFPKELEGFYEEATGSCLRWGARSSLMWPLGLPFI